MAGPRSSTARDHLTVPRLSPLRAGPTCREALAEFCANVFKIEAPDRASLRAAEVIRCH